MKLSLQHKILFGYIISVAVIGSMAAILLHERTRIREIAVESDGLRAVGRSITAVHREVTELATLGESVIGWDEEDFRAYRAQRLRLDSLLLALRRECVRFVRPEQVDTLRMLLAAKETHLLRIMRSVRQREEMDSLIARKLPTVVKSASKPRIEVRRKKGIAGFFGKKDTIRVYLPSNNLRTLNSQITTLKDTPEFDFDAPVDSLRRKNKQLNRELSALISLLDGQIQKSFDFREKRISDMRQTSFRILSCVLGVAILLLILSYIIIQRDIRRREAGERKLKEIIGQNRDLLDMRKKIILTISHDIRAPLSIINGSAELAMGTRDRKRRNSHLANIGILCKHILHLLNNLLDVYRLNEAKETRNDTPFRLSDLLERIAAGFTRAANDKGLLFQCDFEGTDVTVCGDSDRIEQIADNLLSNAVKFTGAGSVGFTARYENGTLLLTVEDTGIGMSGETAARIFDPFERSAPDTNAEGFGLGLSITKGLVGLLDGEITVASEVGKGSTFRVSLPLPLTDETVESETQTHNTSLRLPQRVLAIDDDSLQLEIVKEMLERNGVSCMTCGNTRALVGEMRKADYDLLLSDIQMAGTNGFELLELLRNSNIGNSRTIPVVAMTARGDKEREAFASAGFAACIYKPFSMHELLDLIASVVSDTKPEEVSADFASLTADVKDKKRLLWTFIGQSRKDIAQLREAGDDRRRLREVVHRMLPMWELLQTDELLHSYRDVLHDDKADDGAVGEYTRRVIDRTALLIAEAENEIKRLTNETEDIDRGR
ncbi:MAG: hybrid sensor histidine kinase/response regulator [Rikenellaceae bacterium]|nr:hybrid sensor histidine kinase/response regulator [Rikenellaceae bacterium]